MIKNLSHKNFKKLHQKAYQNFEDGQLSMASQCFAKLVQYFPDKPYYHYMQGLVAKNRGDWQLCLNANLKAIELWQAQGQHRVIKQILHQVYQPTKPTDGKVWWIWQE